MRPEAKTLKFKGALNAFTMLLTRNKTQKILDKYDAEIRKEEYKKLIFTKIKMAKG